MKQNFYKRQINCRYGVSCRLLQQGRCKDIHTKEEQQYVSTLDELYKINIIGVVIFEGNQNFIVPKGKDFAWGKAIILNDNQQYFDDLYYEAQFVYFEFQSKYPCFEIVGSIGKIDNIRNFGLSLVYYNKYQYPQHEDVPEKDQDVMRGIYRVLFGNQHVIKSDSIKKKLYFQNEWDRNRAIDNSDVLFRMTGKETAKVIKIIKNPIQKIEMIGLIGIGDASNLNGDFCFEARVKQIEKGCEKQVDIQIGLKNNKFGIYFRSLNPFFPTFRVIGVNKSLLQNQNLLYQFVVGKFIDWNRKSDLPWIEIIDEEQSIAKIKNYQRAILQRNHVNTDQFSNKVSEEVKGLVEQIEVKLNNSELSQNQLIFSIDSSSTKLIDDAFSIEYLNEKSHLLTVFIADPSQFIKQRNYIYEECKNRFESCYIQKFYQPMMPKDLTKLLSLNQDQKRFAVSLKIVITEGVPDYQNMKLSFELIENKHKLSYAVVENFLTNKENRIKNNDLETCLRYSLQISEALKKQRDKIGCLNCSQDEELDYPLAENLVQQFMLITSEAVGYYIDQSQKKLTEILKQKKLQMNEILEMEYQVKKKNIDLLRLEDQLKIFKNIMIIYETYPQIDIFNEYSKEQQKQEKQSKKKKISQQEKPKKQKEVQKSRRVKKEKKNTEECLYQQEKENINDDFREVDDNKNDNQEEIDQNQADQQTETQTLNQQQEDSDDSSFFEEQLSQPSLLDDESMSDSSMDDELKDDFIEINYSKLEQQDAERNINFLNNQILSRFGLKVDLESQQFYKQSKSYIFSQFNKNKFLKSYIKFLFKVKEKYIKILITEKENQAKKLKNQLENQKKNNKDLENQKQKVKKQNKRDRQTKKEEYKQTVTKTEEKMILVQSQFQKILQNQEINSIEQTSEKEQVKQCQNELSNLQIQSNINQQLQRQEIKSQKEIKQKVEKQDNKTKKERRNEKNSRKQHPVNEEIREMSSEEQQINDFGCGSSEEFYLEEQKFQNQIFQLESMECNKFSNYALNFLFTSKHKCIEINYSISNTQFEQSNISFIFVTDNVKQTLQEEIQQINNQILVLNKQIYDLKSDEPFDEKIEFNSENNIEIMLKYSNLPENKKMKFTSPLRKFHDLMVHYLIGQISNLYLDIQEVILQIDKEYEKDLQNSILENQQQKRGKRKMRKKKKQMKDKSKYYKEAYKLLQKDIENIKIRKQNIIEVVSNHKDTSPGSLQKAQREISVLQICQYIISKNCSKKVEALITSIDKGKKQVQVFFITDGIEMEEILEFDYYQVQFDKFDIVRLFKKGEKNQRDIVLQVYDKCYVQLDCDGYFPLQLSVFFHQKI